MDKLSESMTATLKAHGYSITKPRKTVFMALVDREPQSIGEIAKTLNGSIDRASMYRVLALFESLTIVERLVFGWKYKFELSDSFVTHHHHATCTRCGKFVSFEESDILKRELKKQAETVGFVKISHQLEIRGVCDACQ